VTRCEEILWYYVYDHDHVQIIEWYLPMRSTALQPATEGSLAMRRIVCSWLWCCCVVMHCCELLFLIVMQISNSCRVIEERLHSDCRAIA
jgi:bacteriorhodopsin